MQQEDKIIYTYNLDKEEKDFINTLFQILRQSKTMDEVFLTRINLILQTKNIIRTQEISQLSLVLSLSTIPQQERYHQNLDERGDQLSYKNVEYLQKVILQWKRPTKQKIVYKQLMGWISKIWDKILHFSCYKNYLDLIILYYFIGQFLYYPQNEFKRLLNLLLQSVYKIKQFTQQILNIILLLLQFFNNSQQIKYYTIQTKTKLKILNILYISKLNNPKLNQIKIIKNKLQQINQIYIHIIMQQLQKNQDNQSISQDIIIWDKLFTTLLILYSKYDNLKSIILKLIIQMISFKLDLQTMKLLVKQLQITNQQKPLKKWKQIFHIMTIALKIYQQPKQCLIFLSQKSYIKYPIQTLNFIIQLEIKTSTKICMQQKILFMLQDKYRLQQIWFIIRKVGLGQAILIILRVQKQIITQKVKLQTNWSPYNFNGITIQLSNNQISLYIQDKNIKLSLGKIPIQFNTFIIGDQDGNFGTSIKNLLSLSIYNNQKKQNSGLCYKMQINNKNQFRGIKKKVLPSFIQIMRMIGDLDIFLMIISHAIKKMKRNNQIVDMIRQVINLLQKFVQAKKVKNIKVNPAQRQKRLNAILCLCWQCSHQTFNALAVLQLLRFLNIRGVSNPDDELQILCNFVFWKQFEWQYQKLMIMKIKQLFSEIRIRQNNHKYIKKYCQRILQQTALYYRQQQYTTNGIQIIDNILKIHYQFLILVKQQLYYLLNDKKNYQDYYQFIQFILKLLYWTLSKKHNIIDSYDITFSIQLSFFIRELGQKIKQWIGKQDKILKIIKDIIDIAIVYQNQSLFYQDKKFRLYNGDKYLLYDDKIIKENLYFLAYSIAILKNNILNLIIDTDDKGFNQICCVIWQKKIIQPLILSIDKSHIYQLTTQQLNQIKNLYDKLSIKSLSYDQNKLLLTTYLSHDKFFNQRDNKLNNHFSKIINIKDLIQIILYILKNNKKSQITNQSKVNDSFQSHISELSNPKFDKIITLIGTCDDLNYQQGSIILSQLNYIYNPKQTKLYFLTQHYILKGLVKKCYQIVQNQQSSIKFINSLSQIDQSNQQDTKIYIKTQLLLNRQTLIGCLQYYYKLINLNDLLTFHGLKNSQQGQCHLQNYRINIQCIINSIGSTDSAQIYKLKNYYYFLQKQLLPLSKYFIQQLNIKPSQQKQTSHNKVRKSSKDLPQFPKFDLKQQSKTMYITFLDERNFNLLKVQKVWLEVQQRNKAFWSTFIVKQFQYTLYEATGLLNERYLLKKASKKPKLELPKMIMKGSIQRSGSISILSERFEFNEEQSTSSIFDDAHLYRKDPVSCFNIPVYQQGSKQSFKSNKFRVLLITSSKIYQGNLIFTTQKKLAKIIFKQNEQINFDLYQKIFAGQCQKRHQDECIKQNYCFEQQITSKCIAISKRYLFHDIALQIHTKNRSHFFIFNKKDHRQAFIYLIQKYIRVLNRDKLLQQMKYYCQKWQNGFISNYHYLMKLNDLTGRSLNDLSQYYIFPWTVINFQDVIDQKFIQKKQNFRDLSLPVGKLNKSKWEDIKKKYQMKKQMRISQVQIPNFLYGSFYSNRAIVCNFLIRISPFSQQHYQLQSQKFDTADRLFYSIFDSYKSLMTCSADFKELIPEFYYFPQFLKNRCAYNLGSRQNKDIVHNVILPKWALDEYQFVFKMRKMLQCQIITTNLHNWIDLILGVYANKKYAIKADNLFLGDLYLQGYQKYLLQKDKTTIQLFKQFGQVPVPIINQNHTHCKVKNNYIDSILHYTIQINQYIPNKSNDIGKIVQIYFYKRFTILLFQKQLRLYQQQRYDKQSVIINGDFEGGGGIKIWQMYDTQDKKHYCLTYHKKKTFQVIGYQIKKNIFNKYNIQGGQPFPFKHKCSLISTYQNYIFCAEDKNIYIYKNIQQDVQQQYSTQNYSLICNITKTKYLLSIFGQITHHKSRIIFMKSNQRGLIITIDQQNKCYITQISSSKTSIFNCFQIKGVYFQEKLVQLQIHNMGLIILRTDYDRILVYSFTGDIVVAKHLNFEKNTNHSTQKPLCMAIWNQQLSQMIIGTNLGNLWKIDLFELRKLQIIKQKPIWIQKIYLNKSGFRKQGLLKMNINRFGKHFSIVIFAQNGKVYQLKSQKWQDAKKVQILRKKITNFW